MDNRVTVNQTKLTDKLSDYIRKERDKRMDSFAWRIERNTREVSLGLTPTDDITILHQYMQELADVPEQPGFPDTVEWPIEP